MDLRREPRLAADQSVVVTILGKDVSEQQTATIRNASGRGLAMEVAQPISPGAALKIELDDSMVLGEAVYCQSRDGVWLVGVELDQVLCSLSQLGKKLQEFADLQSGRQLPDTVQHRQREHRQ